MSKRVQIASNLEGEIAEPNGDGAAPTLVLVQEYWGVNDHVRSLVDRFAQEGFLVVAPDLYHGKVTKSPDEAGKLMQALDKAQAVKEIGEAVAYVQKQPRSNGKVGVTGFCLGGALTFAAAANVPGIAAAVPFYGVPPMPVDWTKVTAPILAHFSKTDKWATPSAGVEIKRAIEKAGRTSMRLELYDADHAFMNDTRPEVHSPENAKLAWQRTVAFLKEKLA